MLLASTKRSLLHLWCLLLFIRRSLVLVAADSRSMSAKAAARPISSFLYARTNKPHSIMTKRSLCNTNSNSISDAGTHNDAQETQYFLLKSEPADYSILDLERDGAEEWDGIRNYQARNFLRAMKVGDRAFFYHSKAAKPALTGIVGTCKIVREAQPDASALDPKSEYYDPKCTRENSKWDSVLVEHEQSFPVVLSLKEMKDVASEEPNGLIAGLALLKQSRLSVVPVEKDQWDEIIRLLQAKSNSESNTQLVKDDNANGIKRQKV